MTSQIRVDEITNRSGLGTVTIYDNGFEFTGVTTFKEDVDITGGLTIGGVLTYEDTTNIDSVGLITARAGIRVTGDSIHVESSEDRLLYLKSTDANAYLTFEDTDSSSAFANRVGTVSDGLYFSTGGGGERLRILSTGTVNIGGQGLGDEYLGSTVKIRKDQNSVTRLSLRNENSGSGSASAIQVGAHGNSWMLQCGSAANDSNAFTIRVDGSANSNTGTEKLRITTAGDMGLGTASPTARLDVRRDDTDGKIAEFHQSTGYGIQIRSSQSVATIRAEYNQALVFETGTTATERLRIDSDGKVGINTVSPRAVLDIEGNAENFTLFLHSNDANANLQFSDNTGGARILNYGGDLAFRTGTNAHAFGTGDSEALRITSDNKLGINITNPTRQLEIYNSSHATAALQSDTQSSLFFSDPSDTNIGQISYMHSGNYMYFRVNDAERLRIDSYGKIGINETAPTARLDINHPHTEQGLVVRSRYGNIATAMVKFDGDPDSDGGDGNVLHLHGGSSRTDSEILHIDSSGVGDIFDIRGDGLTRVYKQLQLEHSSNVAKIIFNEYGANDPKAQIEMDQVNGSAGQLIFRTQDSGTLSERLRITDAGYVGINRTSPTERIHMSGAIRQDGWGNNVQYHQACFAFSSGTTHTIYTLSGNGNDATAIAVFEYVCLYSYAGTNHEAGIIYASTRRTGSNTAWHDLDNIAADQAGNDSSIRPNLFWQNGVLKITVGSSVQCTGTLRLTTRRFTVTRNFNAE